MTLTLRALSLNDLPLSQPIAARFDEDGGTIGRTDNNTLALPDPERHISRQQAEIRVGRDGYLIRNVGSANPILVRNQTLAFGETATLLHSDRVRIGGYLLEVVDDGNADATTLRTPAITSASASAFGSLGTPLSSGNPFAEFFGAPPARPAARDGAPEPMARLPDDFDPLAAPAAEPAPASPETDANPANPFGDLLGTGDSRSLDDMFDLRPVDGRDPLADFASDLPPSQAGRPGERATDTLSSFGLSPPAVAPAQTLADHASDLHSAFALSIGTGAAPRPARTQPEAALEPVVPPSPSPSPPPPLPSAKTSIPMPAPEPVQQSSSGWAAFCEGAGIPPDAVPTSQDEALRAAGLMLRTAIEGTMGLMKARAQTRVEMRGIVTMIHADGNNPLKFSPDAQAALEQMLRPPMRGFMHGPAALTAAMNDLLGHGIGMMTGTRAAIDGMLARFAPQQLESQLAPRGMLDTLLPANRKARLWELYVLGYERIRGEAHGKYQQLFGEAFVDAYEEQVKQLRHEQAETASRSPGRG